MRLGRFTPPSLILVTHHRLPFLPSSTIRQVLAPTKTRRRLLAPAMARVTYAPASSMRRHWPRAPSASLDPVVVPPVVRPRSISLRTSDVGVPLARGHLLFPPSLVWMPPQLRLLFAPPSPAWLLSGMDVGLGPARPTKKLCFSGLAGTESDPTGHV